MKAGTLIIYLLLVSMTSSYKMTQNQSKLQTKFDRTAFDPDLNQNSQEKDSQTYKSKSQEVDTIYFNGNILTMNDQYPVAQAVSLRQGLIVEVGSNSDVFSRAIRKQNKINLIDLHGKTMMPGFYDAHSHVGSHSVAKSTRLNLSSPPIGNITTINQIIDKIKAYIQQKNIAAGELVYCTFYNQLALDQKRHITRFQLDQASDTHIIVVEHISGHLSVTNTKAIQVMGVTDTTPDPPGGVIQRFKDGPFIGTPTGLFKEIAKFQYPDRFSKGLSNNTQSQKIVQTGIEDYIRAGVTTVQQGLILQGGIQLLLQMKDKIKIDYRGYVPCLGEFNQLFDQYAQFQTNRFKLQGIKLIIDGSIQGYTGYLSQPYFVQPGYAQKYDNNLQIEVQQEDLYRGFPLFSQSQISQILQEGVQRQIDVLAHCNGDAAIDIFLEAARIAKNKYPFSKSRLTIIHAQTIREDQLDQVKKLDITPSFFVGHTYFWGDEHRDRFLGPERASRISPTASALLRGIDFTLHNDAPVTPIENGIFEIIWCAVNRMTQSGQVLGEQQKINVGQALRSLTINAAYQGHQQHIKGSIQKGKYADFIILSENPLKINPIRLKQIKVQQTIKNGVSIFRRNI